MAPLNRTQIEIQQALVQAANNRTRQRRRPAKPKPPPTLAYRLELQRLVKQAIAVIEEEVKGELKGLQAEAEQDRLEALRGDGLRLDGIDEIHADQVDDFIDRIIENVRLRLGILFDEDRLRDIATRHGLTVDRFSEAELGRQLGSVLGIDVATAAPNIGRRQVRLFVRENVSLIKSIPDTLLSQVERTLTNGASQGLRAGEIAKEIEAKFKTSRARARLIARDQVNKLSNQLSQLRQQNVGVTEYLWRNSGDARVRGNPDGLYPNARFNHWNREGVKFRFDKPPPDGNPGEPHGCRCRAEPVFDQILEDLAA